MKKMLLKLSGLSFIGGLLLALWTAGKSDINALDFNSIVIRGAIATALIVIGYIGLKVNKWEYLDDEV
jgi:hypothetical protein